MRGQATPGDCVARLFAQEAVSRTQQVRETGDFQLVTVPGIRESGGLVLTVVDTLDIEEEPFRPQHVSPLKVFRPLSPGGVGLTLDSPLFYPFLNLPDPFGPTFVVPVATEKRYSRPHVRLKRS